MAEALTAPVVIDRERSPSLIELGRAVAASPRAEVRSRRVVAGRGLVVVGLLALLFIGFELSVSGLEEQRAQAALLPAFQSGLATTTMDRPTVSPVEGSAIALLQIPRLGMSQVVVEGTTPTDLKSGPGHLRGSPIPGEYGNSVIAGRRTTYGGPFGQLNTLARGDTIKIATGQGFFVYTVREVRRVSPGQPDPVVGTTDSRLTLITSDPAYLASGRLAVVATLHGKPVAVDRRAPQLVGPGDLGLTGDSLGLGLGIVWGELLLAGIWVTWRVLRRWPAIVVYLIAAPILLALAVLTFSSFDLLLPGTL